MHTHIYIYIYMYTYVYIYICIFIYMYIYTYIYIYACVCECICVCTCVCINTHIYAFVSKGGKGCQVAFDPQNGSSIIQICHIRICVYICIWTYTYIYICVWVCLCMRVCVYVCAYVFINTQHTRTCVCQGGKGFSVAFDPLDGSSIVATNFTVGTIAGVWAGDSLVE